MFIINQQQEMIKMRYEYIQPELEIMIFDTADVIATSDETDPLDPANDG